MSFFRWLVLLLICSIPASEGVARQISSNSRSRPTQGVGLALIQTEFSFDGVCATGEPSESCALVDIISFSEPMYGIVFSRKGLMISVSRGSGNGTSALVDREELTDFSISTWTEWHPFGSSGPSRARVFVPIGLHSNYRKFSREFDGGNIDEFESTVVGVGAGLGAVTGSGAFRISARGMPIFGLASRTVGFGTGSSTIIEADLEISYGPMSGRFGLLVGYGYRWQRWNLDDTGFSSTQNYTGTKHGFRAGVTW